LIADGGNVELVDVQDGIVSLKLTGACAGCPMSTLTLKNGIERILKEELSDVKEVVSVDTPV
jgi:Fe-S cluster biogenesis protein NfuA